MGRSGYEITFLWAPEDSETPNSICSADTPPIEEDHLLFQLKDSFLQVVMKTYQKARGRQQDERTQVIDNKETPSEQVELDGDGNRPRKRGRLENGASAATGDKQSQKSFTKRRPQDRRLWLACPFAKKDPVRYRHCYRYFLARVRDVKQHLTRCHRKPLYCPVCNDIFEDEDERDSHIGLRNCTHRPDKAIEGISEKQRRELSQRVSSKMPEEQQWFAVFDTLFSPHPRPRTPYRDRELSDDLCVFQDLMGAQGPTLLADFLESTGVVTWNLPHEERDLAAFKRGILGEGLQLIIDQWMSDNTTALEPACDSHSPPSSPTVDSGIAMRSDERHIVNERHKTNDSLGSSGSSEGERQTYRTNDGGCEEDNRYTFDIFNQASNLGERAGTLQTDVGAEHSSQDMVVEYANSFEAVSADSSEERALEVTDALATSQFAVLPGYCEATTFPEGSDVPYLLDLDIVWPH